MDAIDRLTISRLTRFHRRSPHSIYMARYTHRVAISNRRLVSADDDGVAFRWKDYRLDGPDRWKTMTLNPLEFIRCFLIHVLPKGFHGIRHYGLFANGNRCCSVGCPTARDFVPWRFSDACLYGANFVKGMPQGSYPYSRP